jgi:hypothetical protein
MSRRKQTNGLDQAPKAPRRAGRGRHPLGPIAGEDVSLEDLTFSPRGFYEAELDKLGEAHAAGKGRKYADDARIKSGLRKRAKARGWDLDFLHIDVDGKPALIARISKIDARVPRLAVTPAELADLGAVEA